MLTDRLILAGVAALSAVATAGWMRHTPAPAAPQAMNFAAPMLEPDAVFAAQPAAYGVPAGTAFTPGVYQQGAVQTTAVRQSNQSARTTHPVDRVYDDRRVTRKRSTAQSAAIIGGGAAAGAAIGGLAGGGKGAAIGAATGAAGGLVYDRMTHKKTEPVDQGYRSSRSTADDDLKTGRSTGERAAIIGGSAAAGAAIGGLAGGGKGAAIGAITGGAGGYIYDSITKNR